MWYVKYSIIVYKILKCVYIFQLIVSSLIIFGDVVSGKGKAVNIILFFIIEVGLTAGWIIGSRFEKKEILYIEIENKTMWIKNVHGKEQIIPFSKIKRIIFKTNVCLFEIYDKKTLHAWRIRGMWGRPPCVKKDGTEHKGILKTDFIGVRIDEDYSGMM